MGPIAGGAPYADKTGDKAVICTLVPALTTIGAGPPPQTLQTLFLGMAAVNQANGVGRSREAVGCPVQDHRAIIGVPFVGCEYVLLSGPYIQRNQSISQRASFSNKTSSHPLSSSKVVKSGEWEEDS